VSRAWPLAFALRRQQDVTGVSGTGTVAHGTQFPDGQVVLRWTGEYASTVIWESIDAAMHVHGHDGKTTVAWANEAVLAAEIERLSRGCGMHPDSFGYEHPDCGFHWHGRNGADVPTDGMEPICPRCELARTQAEVSQLREAVAERDGELAMLRGQVTP
jgi:hypothetical protein